ncbi:unnamed protein product [Ectocarpus sp. 4 AP-2014]
MTGRGDADCVVIGVRMRSLPFEHLTLAATRYTDRGQCVPQSKRAFDTAKQQSYRAMDASNALLLDERSRDAPPLLPALQNLLQLAHAGNTDDQAQAAMGISTMVKRVRIEPSSFGPLCHTLSRLVASEHQAVVAYAARSIKILVVDDALRPQAAATEIPSVLATALKAREGDTACLREILGALQTLCYDKETVLSVITTGALEPVLELLSTSNLELKILSMAIAANVLSFSDSLLMAHEECIDAFRDRMEALLDPLQSRRYYCPLERDLALAALANACGHRVLAERAEDLGAIRLLRRVLKKSRSMVLDAARTNVVSASLTRLERRGFIAGGDVEAGGGSGEGTGGGLDDDSLRFYRFKWDTHRFISAWAPESPAQARKKWTRLLVRTVPVNVFACFFIFLMPFNFPTSGVLIVVFSFSLQAAFWRRV